MSDPHSAFRRNYYTDAKLSRIQANLATHGWARESRDQTLASAERWAGYEDGKLRTLVVPPEVPRAYQVHNFGCPVHGVEVHRDGLYKWIIDFDRPFKIKCPVGGEEYPSNDFAAFLDSGMKDKALLTGPYADDGWGWHRPDDPDEANYWFVAYYAHWSMNRYLMEAIRALSLAALLAEDAGQARTYAHKCALLLWQLAVHYPDYAYEKQSREGREHNPQYTGKLWNMIWEVTTPYVCAPAYDAIRPFLPEDAELQERAGMTAEEIDAFIRSRLLMESAQCITDGTHRISGNYGSHQKSLLLLAQVLNEKTAHPTSQEMLDYVVANPRIARQTDLGFRDAFENLLYRDGIPHESIGYNQGWVSSLTQIAKALTELGLDFFGSPRFRKLLTWPFEVRLAGRFTPSSGDTADMFARNDAWDPAVCRIALPHIRDSRIGWLARTSDTPAQDLLTEPIDELLEACPDGPPEMGLRSCLFPAYGLAHLQSGSEENRTAVSLFYGSHIAHLHHDQLNLALFSHGNALLTDFGYPEQTDAFNHRLAGYFVNTIAHNTVVVDARKQGRGKSRLYAFEPNGFAQIVDASCNDTYGDDVSLYRRSAMLVETTPTQSYLFDVFYVHGGEQHDYSAHGTQADFDYDLPLSEVQQDGTLAGEDVPYEQFYDDPELRDETPGAVRCSGYRGSGYQFLTNVRRAALDGEAVCEWRLTEPKSGQPERLWEDIALRAHALGKDEELIVCDGPVQKYAYLPKTVKFMIRRRTGEALASSFASVYEPYRGEPWIRNVSPVALEPDDGRAAAALVEMEDGERHYVYHSLVPERTHVLDGEVRVDGQAACLVLDRDGQPIRAMLLNGTELRWGEFVLGGQGLRRSRIVAVDYAKGIVEIGDPLLDTELRPGQVILVAPDTFADCLTLHEVLDETHFSVGDEDFLVAGGPMLELDPDRNEVLSNVPHPHAQVGMMVLNSRHQPQGRFGEKTEAGWLLDRTGFSPDELPDFPKAEGDATPRYSIVMAGPGDEVVIPHLATFELQ